MYQSKVEARVGGWGVWTEGEWKALYATGGGPISLLDGWVPDILLSGIGPIALLVLRHDSGATASWFFDQELTLITNSFAALPAAVRDAIIVDLREAALSIWRSLIIEPLPHLEPGACAALTGAPRLLNEVCQALPSLPELRVDLICLDVPADIDQLAGHSTDQVYPQPPIMAGIFERDFLADIVAAVSAGRLTLPSPFDGRLLSSDIGLVLTPGTTAYRFYDERHDAVFYAVGSLWRTSIPALYFPQLGLLVCRHRQAHSHLMEFIGGAPLETVIFHHVLEHAEALEQYLAAPSRELIIVYVQEHLGHHLYNELGGFHRVVKAASTLPRTFLIRSPQSEMYGRLDELFPEAKGRIDRTHRSAVDFAKFTYAERLFPVRPTDNYVPREVASRIFAALERDPALAEDRDRYAGLVARGVRLVTLGLRVENRTLVDQLNFFCEVIDVLREKLGPIALVVDGHDAVDGAEGAGTYLSHGDNFSATRSVVGAEMEILEGIRARFADRPDVEVISMVGTSMARTLFWCSRSSLFVAPWGAGLAKYCWVCNLPGLVVAGEHFLCHSGPDTVHLYDSRKFMEDPVPSTFFAVEDVEDDPTAPLLIGLADANRVNYRVRPGAVRARVVQAVITASAR